MATSIASSAVTFTQTSGGANNLPAVPTITAGNTGTPTVVVDPIYGLNVSNALHEWDPRCQCRGGSPEGALVSLNGINTHSGGITIGDNDGIQTGSIGVLSDDQFTGFPGEQTVFTGTPHCRCQLYLQPM